MSYYPDAVKHHKRAIALNLAAAAVNFAIWINAIRTGEVIGWINLPTGMASLYFAHESYHRLKEAQREEKEYVVDVLSGKIG